MKKKSTTRPRARKSVRRAPWYARVPKFVLLLAGVLVFVLVAAGAVITTDTHKLDEELPDMPVIGSVINAVTANTESVGIAGPLGDLVEAAVGQHGAIAVYQVNGDGTVQSSTVDFTPRLPHGSVIKVDASSAHRDDRADDVVRDQLEHFRVNDARAGDVRRLGARHEPAAVGSGRARRRSLGRR